MLQRVIDYLRPPPLRAEADLGRFMSGEAAYLAQRSTYEYCRNTLAYFGQHMFADTAFNEAFRRCRWEAFAAVLADMTATAAPLLRQPAGAAIDEPLVGLYARLLAEYEVPAHRPHGWDDVIHAMRGRLLSDVLATEPGQPESVRRVYDVLPVYSTNREADLNAIAGAIRFGLVGFADRLKQRLDAAAVARDMLGR